MADSRVRWGDSKFDVNDTRPLYDKAGKNIRGDDYFAPDTDYYTRIGTKMGGSYSTPSSAINKPDPTQTNLTPPPTPEDEEYWTKRRSLLGITDEGVI